MEFAVDDVDPLILMEMAVARTAARAGDSNTQIAPSASSDDTLQSFGSPPIVMCSSNLSFPAPTLNPSNIFRSSSVVIPSSA
jgi:hypothetical protein